MSEPLEMQSPLPPKKLTTWQVLRNKFPANEYVLIEEVSDASGFSRSISLDYMLINLWESRGLAVTGIEKKSNRGDWLKELKQPEKQEKHFKYCDYFFLLTDKEGVAKLEEIPVTWGWYHINEKGMLKMLKAAPKLKPEPIGRSLMCAMMRRAADKTNYVHKDEIEDRIETSASMKAERIKQENTYKVSQYDSLKRSVDDFQAASGLRITDHWDSEKPKEMGACVRLILNEGMKGYEKRLERLQGSAASILEDINKDMDELKKITKP